MSGGKRFYYSDVTQSTRVSSGYLLAEVRILNILNLVFGTIMYFGVGNEVAGKISIIWTVLVGISATYASRNRLKERMAFVPEILKALYF